jgi:hypothetical protein
MPLAARRALAVLAISVALPAIAAAPAAADTSSCPTPTLTQPFSAWGDDNWYALVPGQLDGSFVGGGWVLGGGASVRTATVLDGKLATVLDLPSGAWAISPSMCVDPTYISARMMLRGVGGASDLTARVSYGDYWNLSSYRSMGTANGGSSWQPSSTLSMNPPGSSWQVARFMLMEGNDGDESQVYDLFVDPYSRG